MPGAASSVDAFAVLLHYGAEARDTGIAMLPGGLFGYRNDDDGFVLRGTLAVPADDLCRFAGRLRTPSSGSPAPEDQNSWPGP